MSGGRRVPPRAGLLPLRVRFIKIIWRLSAMGSSRVRVDASRLAGMGTTAVIYLFIPVRERVRGSVTRYLHLTPG